MNFVFTLSMRWNIFLLREGCRSLPTHSPELFMAFVCATGTTIFELVVLYP